MSNIEQEIMKSEVHRSANFSAFTMPPALPVVLYFARTCAAKPMIFLITIYCNRAITIHRRLPRRSPFLRT